MRSLKSWNKFHLINRVFNASITPPAPHQEDERRTVAEVLEWAYRLWQREGEVTNDEVNVMMEHLLTTKQIIFLCDVAYTDLTKDAAKNLFVKLGTVIFEKDIEGEQVSINAEQVAEKILKNLDDRRNSATTTWPEDVRAEAVNTWAAMIDVELKYAIERATPPIQPEPAFSPSGV